MAYEIDAADPSSNITGLTLNESAENASTLTIQYEGFVDFEYLSAISLSRNGKVMFYGKVTSVAKSSDGGHATTTVTATDALWLLDHTPFGAQVAEIMAEAKKTESGAKKGLALARPKRAANKYMRSWAEAAAAIKIVAGDWTTSGSITVDVSQASVAAGGYLGGEKVISAWNALCRMRQSNPDALIHMEPDGTIRVVSIANAPTLDLGTDYLFSVSDITPLYENAIAGVVVSVTGEWEETVGWNIFYSDGEEVSREPVTQPYSKTTYKCYPADIEPDSTGVKVFTATADSKKNLKEQLDHMLEQARAYYDAVNVLQWGGSITVPLDAIDSSPLMHRVNIYGDGAAEDWVDMAAIVTGVTWDFAARTVTINLGMQVGDLQIHTLEFEDDEDGGSGDGGDGDSDNNGNEGEGNGGGDGGGGGGGGGGMEWEYSTRTDEESGSDDGPHPPIPHPEHSTTTTTTHTTTTTTDRKPSTTTTDNKKSTTTTNDKKSTTTTNDNKKSTTTTNDGGQIVKPSEHPQPSEGSHTENVPNGSEWCCPKCEELAKKVKDLEEAMEKLKKDTLLEEIKKAVDAAVKAAVNGYTLTCDEKVNLDVNTISGREAWGRITAKVSPIRNTAAPPDGDYILSRYGDKKDN